jgi:Sigma-70 region 2.
MPRFAPDRQDGDAPNLLDIAERTFQLLCGESGPLRVDGDLIGYGLPARPISLAELRLILSHPAIGHPVRDAVWHPLITLARAHGDTWIIGCIGLALPALRRLAARLCRTPGDAADVAAEVVVAFTHAVHNVRLDRPRLAVQLHRATRMACLRTRPAASAPAPVPPWTLEEHTRPLHGLEHGLHPRDQDAEPGDRRSTPQRVRDRHTHGAPDPRRHPPAKAFFVTTAKSGPGMTVNTAAKTRKAPVESTVASQHVADL